MVIVLYTEFKLLRSDQFDYYLLQLPLALQEKILRFKKWEDRHASLFGKLLLKQALSYFGENTSVLEQIQYTSYNRPYINGGIDFNISHSGNIAACVISDTCKVGLDIEKKQPLIIENYKGQLSDQQWNAIIVSHDKQSEFYRLWTKKEAMVKAVGQGLNIPFKEIEIEDNKGHIHSRNWFLTQINLNSDFEACVATSSEIQPLTVKKIVFD